EAERQAAGVERRESGSRIDGGTQDLFGMLCRHILDVHAAFRGRDHGDAPARAVDQQGQVEFARDVATGLHVDAVHDSPGRAGLFRHQRVADHRFRRGAHFLDGAREPDAALAGGIVREPSGAAAARMDLRFHHEHRTRQLRRRGGSLIGCPRNMTVKDCHAVALQQLLGLVLVDVHGPGYPISFLAASISSRTAAQDLLNAAFSVSFMAISTIRSTPPAPITTGTPTYKSLMPYWPVSSAAQGRTRFLSFR